MRDRRGAGCVTLKCGIRDRLGAFTITNGAALAVARRKGPSDVLTSSGTFPDAATLFVKFLPTLAAWQVYASEVPGVSYAMRLWPLPDAEELAVTPVAST